MNHRSDELLEFRRLFASMGELYRVTDEPVTGDSVATQFRAHQEHINRPRHPAKMRKRRQRRAPQEQGEAGVKQESIRLSDSFLFRSAAA
jgi:hypothetical protein